MDEAVGNVFVEPNRFKVVQRRPGALATSAMEMFRRSRDEHYISSDMKAVLPTRPYLHIA